MDLSATPPLPFQGLEPLPRAASRAAARDALLIRAIDITIAVSAVMVLLPLLLLIFVGLKLTSPGPVLFAHRRIGKGGQAFPCYKFRSMVVNSAEVLEQHLAENPQARAEWQRDQKLRNDPRVTPIGRLLRRTSLDEVPQIFNVLRGEMSMVGPRPIVEGEMIRYRQYIVDYMSVKPGITGLWQISGRNNTTYRRRVALDTAYARSRTVALDLAILARTVPAVLTGSGCY
ncbi:exopolysaccharide production protein ExoY [Novosphingobium chloroacetimidivorans]|uniref:Exopolysaccharide production protein ExoY n=1 Tax=Novosphingobium chloroacetimidivorans TaxID=1428314 RepID=A0A7W7K7M7_9SPHN|nr:sugar transferase [Novosphingobium chloroacetimidivorans]MBB4857386.1 exopolysaccharide production protein ExoY [Novosphingobium chloroacetimidivorans]